HAARAAGAREQSQSAERETEELGSRISHEEGGRTTGAVVERKKSHACPREGGSDDRRSRVLDEPADEREAQGGDGRSTGGKSVHVVEQVDAVHAGDDDGARDWNPDRG